MWTARLKQKIENAGKYSILKSLSIAGGARQAEGSLGGVGWEATSTQGMIARPGSLVCFCVLVVSCFLGHLQEGI